MTDQLKQAVLNLINQQQTKKLENKKLQLQKIVSKLTTVRNYTISFSILGVIAAITMCISKFF